MNRTTLALTLGVLILAGGIAFWYLGWGQTKTAEDVLSVSGNIEVTEYDLSFQIGEKIVRRPIEEGEFIKEGQLIARLERDRLKQEEARREARVKEAEARLEELTSGFREEEIQQARARVNRFEAEVRFWETELARRRRLFRGTNISKAEVDEAERNLEVARARRAEAREQLRLLRNGPRPEQIRQARQQLSQAREALNTARLDLERTRLVSPVQGFVLADNLDTGEFAPVGTPVVTVADLTNVWVRAYVNETDLGRVKLGQPATVTTDSFPDKTYRGRVSFIADRAEFTPRAVQTREQRVKLMYRIKIDVENPRLELKPGMPVDARIQLDGNS